MNEDSGLHFDGFGVIFHINNSRDNQNYDGMISLIDDLARIQDCQIINAVHVRFLYAFALNRWVFGELPPFFVYLINPINFDYTQCES